VSLSNNVHHIARFVRTWLEDWGSDLEDTAEAYQEAMLSGTFNGRKIPIDMAKIYAKQFHEKAEAVYLCGEQLERDILKEFSE